MNGSGMGNSARGPRRYFFLVGQSVFFGAAETPGTLTPALRAKAGGRSCQAQWPEIAQKATYEVQCFGHCLAMQSSVTGGWISR